MSIILEAPELKANCKNEISRQALGWPTPATSQFFSLGPGLSRRDIAANFRQGTCRPPRRGWPKDTWMDCFPSEWRC